ncbi:hypothetical protein [Streptomyces lincolnensis]|uniref:hypothetical protein n=1 Tax=Streptomyces lincolnensis TaxID=1915 RepID=UPI0037D2EF84
MSTKPTQDATTAAGLNTGLNTGPNAGLHAGVDGPAGADAWGPLVATPCFSPCTAHLSFEPTM